MAFAYRLISVLAASPLLVLTAHVCLSRARTRGPRQLVAVAAVFAAALPTGALVWFQIPPEFTAHDRIASMLYASVIYAALSYTYFHFFNMSETARRIRILYEIHRAGKLHRSEMEKLYKSSDIVTQRLIRLIELGQLQRIDDSYVLRGRFLYMGARIVFFWRRVLGFEEGQD